MRHKINKVIASIGVLFLTTIGIGSAQAWDDNQTLITTFNLPAVTLKDGNYDTSNIKTIQFGVWAQSNRYYGNIPSGIKAEQNFIVTEGICQTGSLDQKLACEQEIWNQGQTVTLPGGNYTIEIRPMPNQDVRIAKLFFGERFANGLPGGTTILGQHFWFGRPFDHQYAVLRFFAKPTYDNSGLFFNGYYYWGAASFTWDDSESFGIAHGTDESPIQLNSGDTYNLAPNHSGDHLHPYGFETGHLWFATKQGQRSSNNPIYIQIALHGTYNTTTYVNLGVLVIE